MSRCPNLTLIGLVRTRPYPALIYVINGFDLGKRVSTSASLTIKKRHWLRTLSGTYMIHSCDGG